MRTTTNTVRQLFLSFLVLLMPLMASAHDFEVNKIFYNIISNSEVEVTYRGEEYDSFNEYGGNITLPNTVTYNDVPYSVTSIGDYAFRHCTYLTSITLPEGLTNIGYYAFYECNKLTSPITIPEGVTTIGDCAFAGCSLTEISIPESVTDIGDHAFACPNNFSKVHINSIEAWCKIIFDRVYSNPLYYAHNIYMNGAPVTELVIPEGVTNISDYAFVGCTNLTSITLPEGVMNIGRNAFSGCTNLTAINFPKGLTSIGGYAFYECANLTSITFPEGLTSIGEWAFYGCTNLATITFPKDLTNIGECSFYDCSSLTSITLPEGVTTIGNQAFFRCRSLTSITLSKGVTSIGRSTFSACTNLTSIILPESLTSIEEMAFSSCDSLTSITLPKNVKSMGSSIFYGNLKLINVFCYAESLPTTDVEAFEGINIKDVTLHVPASSLKRYKITAPWSRFGTIVHISDAKVSKITLSQTTAKLTEGEKMTLKAKISPNYATDQSITWTSSNPYVATVDDMGKVTAIAQGTATITATANDGSGVSASCEVTVMLASYVITYLIDNEVFLADTLTRGATITLPNEPSKEGYTFSGWSEAPETMPAHDIVIEGTFNINSYQITYMVDGEPYYTDSIEYNAEIVPINDPIKEGYSFSGWKGLPETMPANAIVATGTFSINSYTVTYMLDGKVYKIATYKYGETIIPEENPPITGYVFSGWLGLPETMPAENIIIVGTYAALDGNYTDNQGVRYVLKESNNTYIVSSIAQTVSNDITIPTEINGFPVTTINEGAFITAERIESIIVPKSITAVGKNAFYGCKDLLLIEWYTTAPLNSDCFDEPERNGNLLVYVSDTTTKVTYKGNVIVNGNAEQITISDDMPLRIPHEFTARNVAFTHKFTKKTKIGTAGGWEAMILPFDVQQVVSETKGELKPFGEADLTTNIPYWLAGLQEDGTFTAIQNIVANKPFIIQLPNSDEYEERYNIEGNVTFSAKDATLHATVDFEQEMSGSYSLIGSYEGTEAMSYVYALNDEEYATVNDTYMPGGIFVANSRDIRPFEAYIYNASPNRAPYLHINGNNTGIEDIIVDRKDDAWYTLQGVRLSGKPIERGIYIHNLRVVKIGM